MYIVNKLKFEDYFLVRREPNSKKKWYMRLKSDFLRSLISPFCICWEHKVETFLWLMFVIVAGQLGTIINIIKRWVFDGWELLPALGPDSASGSFYTFALVMIASLIGPIFVRFVNKKTPEYRPITIVYVTILIFSLLFCALYYSFATQDMTSVNFKGLKNNDMCLDIKQFVFFVLAIVFSWYSFGLALSPDHEKDLNLDYQAVDDQERNDLSNKANQAAPKPTVNQQTTSTQHTSNSNFEDIQV